MGKKHTIGFVREQFEKEGYTLLSKEYINAHQKLKYVCPEGHIGSISWDCWKRGNRCWVCGGSYKLVIEYVRKQFSKEGYVLLTKGYINNHQKLKYICPKGHIGTIRWNNWKSGARCKKCACVCIGNRNRYTTEFVRGCFEKEGYIFLTKKYMDSLQKLKYVCPNGHYGEIAFGSWQRGRRCAECAGVKKYKIEFIRSEFEGAGYILMSERYINGRQKLSYICPRGHYGTICFSKWQQGQRCPKCYFENNKGKNNPNWNPNLTNEDRLSRRLVPGYREWRTAVYERDNFTCQVCGDKRGGNLISHHLESYKNNPELRLEINNGICLCENCHNNFHHIYGWGNSTKEQFEKFISKEKIE